MAIHQKSILIARPLEEVFAYMDDVSLEHEWQPQLLEAEQTPPGTTAVGTRRRYVSDFLGRRVTNTYVVELYEPGRRVVLQSTPDSVVRARTDIRWEAVGEGTRVTMALEGTPTGVLRFVPKALLEATFEKEVASTLERLKARLETGA